MRDRQRFSERADLQQKEKGKELPFHLGKCSQQLSNSLETGVCLTPSSNSLTPW